MKKTLTVVGVIIVLATGLLIISNRSKVSSGVPVVSSGVGYKDSTYLVDDQTVKITNGVSEIQSEYSSALIVTRYFGNEAKGDLNGDGVEDIVFLLTQNGGGTGTFYFVAVAFGNKLGGYVGANSVFLGDRIAPQTTEIKDGQVIVNYADRNPGESFTTQPSLGVSKYFKVLNGLLVDTK